MNFEIKAEKTLITFQEKSEEGLGRAHEWITTTKMPSRAQTHKEVLQDVRD